MFFNPDVAPPILPSCQKHYIITRTNDAFIIKWVYFTQLRQEQQGTKKDKRMQMFLLLSLLLYIDMPTYILNLDCMGIMIRIWVQTYRIVGAFHEKLAHVRIS